MKIYTPLKTILLGCVLSPSLLAAPSVQDFGKITIISDNDLNPAIKPPNAILVSKPINATQASQACNLLGEKLSPVATWNEGLVRQLTYYQRDTPSEWFWAEHAENCTAFNPVSGQSQNEACDTELLVLCTNSANASNYLYPFDTSKQIVVNTTVGQIQGYRDNLSFRFLGIPYASQPQRFYPSTPLERLPNVNDTTSFDATKFGPACPQPDLGPSIAAEDCLNLNVYTSDIGNEVKLRPVMVYIYGGAFVTGSNSIPIYDGGHIVSRGNVVMVSINYRLGALGFLYYPQLGIKGNQGILDQQLAIKWVKDNIASFGGDPNKITIFGESAGAQSVRAHIVSPAMKGNFQAAIMQSDPVGVPFFSQKVASNAGDAILKVLKCQDYSCLQRANLTDIVEIQSALLPIIGQDVPLPLELFEPVIDGEVLPYQSDKAISSGKFNKVPLMIGTTRDEYGTFLSEQQQNISNTQSAFTSSVTIIFGANATQAVNSSSLYQVNSSDPQSALDLLARFGTAYLWTCPNRYFFHLFSPQIPTYAFQFDKGYFPQTLGFSGGYCLQDDKVCHGSDLMLVFASAIQANITSLPADTIELFQNTLDRWTAFARSVGNPNPTGSYINSTGYGRETTAKWPLYTNNSTEVLLISTPNSTTTANTLEKENCDFIEEKLGYLFMSPRWQ
ncbi:hypothetical protein K7432_010818 [Basidiobolus ranarum]|uniref:Carboxylic ester hydrolase n=1 Tax=Basidiobolus ranarum TaxID=34480 RepID=A0ABR2WN39_9FUNG